ncbi:MAG: ribosome-binding factor A [Mollicutes bacterium UO1]
MLFNKNNFSQAKNQRIYEREISLILHKIIQKYNLPSCSVSYCQLSARGENVKIYLSLAREENKEKFLDLINKKCSRLIKKEIAQSKKFAYIPSLIFLLDHELETINNLEKILKKFNKNEI